MKKYKSVNCKMIKTFKLLRLQIAKSKQINYNKSKVFLKYKLFKTVKNQLTQTYLTFKSLILKHQMKKQKMKIFRVKIIATKI